jgi:hypothetical protein
MSHIMTVQKQNVERTEARSSTAKQQLIELRAAVAIESNDLAIENRRFARDFFPEGCG